MKEQEISLITSQLAKLKGFDWECRGYYYPTSKFGEKYQEGFGSLNNNKLQFYLDDKGIKREIEKYSAPTQSLLQKWLRDVHNLHVGIAVNQFGYGFMYSLIDSKKCDCVRHLTGGVNFNYTYEQAMEAGLIEALKLINDKS